VQVRIDGKVALVTGAARGIGEAIARRFAAAGALVVAADIDAAGVGELAAELGAAGGAAEGQALDVRSDGAVRALVEQVVSRHGRIDVLVNCAGIIPVIPVEAISDADWDEVIAVNVKGTFFATRAVMAVMENQGAGRIINIASNAGKLGSVIAGVHYAASKAAVISLTKSFARRLAPLGIRVNAVSPGPVRTPAVDGLSAEDADRLRANVPVGRIAAPDEIAAAVLFLASDRADFVSGEILDVDGGITMD